MSISAAAKTQGRHGLSGRRHGSFANKSGGGMTGAEKPEDSWIARSTGRVFIAQPTGRVWISRD